MTGRNRDGSERTILVVEDEPSVLRVETRLLTGAGYRVLPAASPAEALVLVRRAADRPDLLLTDLTLPDMDGYRLAARVREELPDILLVFTSGHDQGRTGFETGAEPAGLYLQKPFTRESLLAIVAQALEGTVEPG
ncbi:MAG TPA: response regulator [Gemmatimonadales bacterium]|nr:response regulator [Gemmatimonadales bacterium]